MEISLSFVFNNSIKQNSFIAECWEFFLNEKCVHSRRLLYGNSFPDMDEMIEISLQMNEVCLMNIIVSLNVNSCSKM